MDTNQPDLQGRVLFDLPISGVDSNGHGTHVAGIIAGSGLESTNRDECQWLNHARDHSQFRGMAPAARLFAIAANPDPEPASDTYLQETAARAQALISNNSWHYANDNAYDLAAARYDAAVRDALPEVPGSQPLLFVFAAGNAGNGAADGSGGDPDLIQSPATAKNVITVGAIDQPRYISNQVWQCATVNGTNSCQTNQPWLATHRYQQHRGGLLQPGQCRRRHRGRLWPVQTRRGRTGHLRRLCPLHAMGPGRLLRSDQQLPATIRGPQQFE